jgi:Zn-finger nucleic acid-binding protein
MNCPACAGAQPLTVGEAAPGLTAYRCSKCQGNWVRLEHYARWRERAPAVEGSLASVDTDVTESASKLARCPDCSFILARYRVASDVSFVLDRCRNCHGVWFDHREWELLATRGLATRLAEVFSEEWQRGLRQAEQEAAVERMFERRLGAAELIRAREVREWLEAHPQRSDVLAYLGLLPATPSRES